MNSANPVWVLILPPFSYLILNIIFLWPTCKATDVQLSMHLWKNYPRLILSAFHSIFLQQAPINFICNSPSSARFFLFFLIIYFFTWFIDPIHRGFLEHWNTQKSLCNVWQCFSCLLEWIEKICKKKIFFFMVAFFLNPLYQFCDGEGQAR